MTHIDPKAKLVQSSQLIQFTNDHENVEIVDNTLIDRM